MTANPASSSLAEQNAPVLNYFLPESKGRHPALERIFADTPWAGAKWRQQLERVAGHEKHEVLNFGLNIRQRAVSVPVTGG